MFHGVNMAKRVLMTLACGCLAAGCVYEDEPAPRIRPNPAPSAEGLPPSRPQRMPERQLAEPALSDAPAAWVPSAERQREWTAIVIHHSATPVGNAAVFDRWHREGNGWDGVGYHFVIGNGSDSSDGEVEPTFRWIEQRAGAHTGGTPDNWANEQAVGICLVGDFNQGRPTAAQMQSLLRLVRFLQSRYQIPARRIYGHGATPGARATDCPGRGFPMADFLGSLGTHRPVAAE
jgi:N-acetyl-anhydromuramyl-L-alanine amidase AmpD